MASTAEEYHELMNAEVIVEIDKLRDIAKHGIPDEVRGEVWKYLLGVQHPDKSKEMSSAQARANEYKEFDKEYAEISKRIKGELSRYQPNIERLHDKNAILIFDHVICAYLNTHQGVTYSSALVHLCGPLVFSLTKEEEVYFCFENLMNIIDTFMAKENQNERLAKFIMLFRMVLPDLYNYFEEEEVDPSAWAVEWLTRLLSKELPLPCLLRLWDTYFSIPDALEIHPYVCLAVLKNFKDLLDDMEHSEILKFLKYLPNMDMDEIITEAFNLKDDISAQGVL